MRTLHLLGAVRVWCEESVVSSLPFRQNYPPVASNRPPKNLRIPPPDLSPWPQNLTLRGIFRRTLQSSPFVSVVLIETHYAKQLSFVEYNFQTSRCCAPVAAFS